MDLYSIIARVYKTGLFAVAYWQPKKPEISGRNSLNTDVQTKVRKNMGGARVAVRKPIVALADIWETLYGVSDEKAG